MSRISDLGFTLIVTDGLLANALIEERRWSLRESEAKEMRFAAARLVKKYSEQLAEAKKELTYASQ